MKYAKTLGPCVLLVALVMAGCTPPPAPPVKDKPAAKDAAKKEEHAPHGKGPNGGVVFDLGKYPGELTVDHDRKECTVLVLGADEKTPTPVAARDLTVTTKETKTREGKVVPPMTIKMVP